MIDEDGSSFYGPILAAAKSGSTAELKALLDKAPAPLMKRFASVKPSKPWWSSAADELFYACEGDGSLEKMGLLLAAGISPKELRPFAVLVPFDPTVLQGSPTDDIDHTAARRRLLELVERGARVNKEQMHPSDVVEIFRCCPDDLELYQALEKAGLDFDLASLKQDDGVFDCYSPEELLDCLVTGSHVETIRFALDKNWGLNDEGRPYATLRASWNEAAVDAALSAGITLGDFDSSCVQDVVVHAVNEGMRPQIPADELWQKVVNSGLAKVGDALVAANAPFPSDHFDVCPKDPAMLDWAKNVGLNPGYIDVNAPRSVLVHAARIGMLPYQRFGKSWGPEQGLKIISDSLDAEVITAFLDAGVEGLDPSAAIEQGRHDIVAAFESHGQSTSVKCITDPEPYIDRDIIRIPEGVTEVAADVFWGGLDYRGIAIRATPWNVSRIELPSTLKSIGDRAFAGAAGYNRGGIAEVVIPPSVIELGYGAFAGAHRIVVYDTINPDVKYKVDPLMNGVTDATIGWAGICPNPHYSLCADGPSVVLHDFEVEVRSAKSGKTKYRVYMPLTELPRAPRSVWITSWGPHGEFHFENSDLLFDNIQSDHGKINVAIDRLLWPIGLSEDDAEKLRAFLAKRGKDTAKILIEDDNVGGLERFSPLNLVKKSNVKDLIAYAKEKDAPRCEAHLEGLRKEMGANDGAKPKK